MAELKEQLNQLDERGNVFFQWQIPEFANHERSFGWYLVASILAIALIIYCIFTANYFFALIIILATFIIFLKKYNEPKDLMFQITEDGLVIGNQFFNFNDLANFYIIYNPPVKKLYFKMKTLNPDDLSIPLLENNPIPIRAKLLEYLSEDLEKEHQTFSDIMETFFKL